ncbi:MAG: HYR domain-containing protein [Chloroflexi bacterium]|nr:HYR domain-containing protein [Chloroflexota bacterium]
MPLARGTCRSLPLPASDTIEATGPDGAAYSFSPSASDLVDGSVAVECDPDSGSTFTLGTTIVKCSATDAAGNKAQGQFSVTVQDTTPPTVHVPGNITKEATSASGASAAYTATASDLVDGSIAAVCTPASGSSFALGTTTVTCTATDAAENEGSATFTVTVADTTAPSTSISGPSGCSRSTAHPSRSRARMPSPRQLTSSTPTSWIAAVGVPSAVPRQ